MKCCDKPPSTNWKLFVFHLSSIDIAGMKVYDSNEKELVFEFAVRWAGNPNIVVALKLLSLNISAQVRLVSLMFFFQR